MTRLSHYRMVTALVGFSLVTRLPLLTISLEEVDTANFVNALKYGYDIPMLRPHPPGYPVYVLLANGLNAIVGDPLRSLALLSAVLGSLAVVPVYFLLREYADDRMAVAGSLLLIVNPLVWSFSEAGLTDIPAMFFAAAFAWLCYRGRLSTPDLLASIVLASLAVGVRQANLCLLPLLIFPLAYRGIVRRERVRDLAVSGLLLFAATTLAWALPMVLIGSNGWNDFRSALDKQYSTAVAIYDLWHVESPWLLNVALRVLRFCYAYFLTFAWTGDDAKTAETLLLVLPWLFGFALFILTFRWSDPGHVFVGAWIATIAYPILTIHFLARYGLSQFPAFLIACAIGYASLGRVLSYLSSHKSWLPSGRSSRR